VEKETDQLFETEVPRSGRDEGGVDWLQTEKTEAGVVKQ